VPFVFHAQDTTIPELTDEIGVEAVSARLQPKGVLRAAAADLWPRLAGLAARGRPASTWQGAGI